MTQNGFNFQCEPSFVDLEMTRIARYRASALMVVRQQMVNVWEMENVS